MKDNNKNNNKKKEPKAMPFWLVYCIFIALPCFGFWMLCLYHSEISSNLEYIKIYENTPKETNMLEYIKGWNGFITFMGFSPLFVLMFFRGNKLGS